MSGEYYPELGYSYAEIAGMSRSQHRSQGMGAPEQKGSQKQYLVTIAGDKATKDVFDGIDTTWSRVPGGRQMGKCIENARDTFAAAASRATRDAAPGGPGEDRDYRLTAHGQTPLCRDQQSCKNSTRPSAIAPGLWLDAAADRVRGRRRAAT